MYTRIRHLATLGGKLRIPKHIAAMAVAAVLLLGTTGNGTALADDGGAGFGYPDPLYQSTYSYFYNDWNSYEQVFNGYVNGTLCGYADANNISTFGALDCPGPGYPSYSTVYSDPQYDYYGLYGNYGYGL